jgi:hypothetical protein
MVNLTFKYPRNVLNHLGTSSLKKALSFWALFIGLVFALSPAKADSYYWTGGTNSNWTTSSNWYDTSNGNLFQGYPQSGDDAYIGVNGPFLLLFSYNYFTGPNNPTLNSAITCRQIFIGQDVPATLTVPNALTVSNTIRVYGSGTINSTAAITVSANNSIVTNAGTMKFTGGSLLLTGVPVTFASSGSFSLLSSSTFTVSNNNTTATNTGTFSVTSSTINYTSSAGTATFVNTSPGSFTAASSTINFLATSGNTLTNTGTYSVTASPISFGAGTCTFNNSGTFSAASGSTITLPANNSSIKNTAGTFTTTGTDIVLSALPSSIQNSGTGTVSIGGATITMAQGSFVTNAGTGSFTVKGTSTVNFGLSSYITNSAIFYAGISGSTCTINMPSTDGTITNNSGALFYLGAASVINPTGSHATIANSGRFTLQSDATGSAAIGGITGGGSAGLTGYYNVERFFTGGSLAANRGYRLMSSPVNESNATASASTFGLSYLNQHTYLNVAYSGGFTGGVASTANGFSGSSIAPTLYLYKESLAANNTNYTTGKHVGISKVTTVGIPTSTTTGTTATVNTIHTTDGALSNLSIPIGNGFLMFFVGPSSRTSGSANGTNPTAGPPQDAIITANGYMNQGNFVVHLWYNTAGINSLSYAAVANPGYCMVGNPYPSTINLATVAAQNAGIDNIYLLNARSGGTNQNYIAYSSTGGTSSPLTPQYAVSGGGFIVHAINGSQTLTFNESQKAPTINPTGTGLIMSAPKSDVLAVDGKLGNDAQAYSQQRTMAMQTPTGNTLSGFYMKMEKDSLSYDYCGVYFSTKYGAKFEDGDAAYMSGPTNLVTIASLTGDKLNAAINNLPDYHNGSHVKLNVNASATGLYQLKMEGIRNMDTLYDIYLVDHLKKDSLDMRRYGVYSFNLIKTDTSTFGTNRFELSIHRKPLPEYLLTDLNGVKVEAGVQINWKTQNEGNYIGFTVEKQSRTTNEFAPIYDAQSNGSATYNFTDRIPNSGVNVYRLKQNDIDGKISYSDSVTVFYDKLNANGLISVFPNPTVEMINVSMPAGNGDKTYNLKVYNSSGYAVLQRTTTSGYWSENVASLRPGVYIVEVIKSDGSTMGKVKFIKN